MKVCRLGDSYKYALLVRRDSHGKLAGIRPARERGVRRRAALLSADPAARPASPALSVTMPVGVIGTGAS